jgi:hypothetical protein
VQIEQQRRHMPQLDVCRAIREWAASGYRRLPALSSAEPSGALGQRWMRDNAALGCGKFSPVTPTEVLRALRSAQQPGRRPNTRDVEVMEVQQASQELRAREDAARALGQALGLTATVVESSKRRGGISASNVPREPSACRGRPELLSQPVTGPAGNSLP